MSYMTATSGTSFTDKEGVVALLAWTYLMKITDSYNKEVLIGDLLCKAGVLNPHDLKQTMHIAKQTSLPIGRILTMYGYVKEAQVQAAIQAQSLLKDRQLTINVAIKALAVAAKSHVTFDEALSAIGWVEKKKNITNKLGELLLAAGMVTENELDHALSRSLSTGLPLGRVLVLTGILTDQLLIEALNTQVLIRDSKLNRDTGIANLRAMVKGQALAGSQGDAQTSINLGSAQNLKLGELFVLSGLLTDTDVMNALELGLINEQPIGEILIQCGFITKDALETALQLQRMVKTGTLEPFQASEVLIKISTTGIPVAQAIAELNLASPTAKPPIRFDELLTLAHLASKEEIQEALDLSSKSALVVGKILFVTGVIDEETMHNALLCYSLVAKGWLSLEEALLALDYCQQKVSSKKTTFDEILHELGWNNKQQHELATLT